MSLLRTTILAAIAGIAAICLIVFLGRGNVRAEEETAEEAPSDEVLLCPEEGPCVDDEGTPIPTAVPRNHFQPYARDEGALQYEALSNQEKTAADRVAEWAEVDSGYAVHKKWAQVSAWNRAHARLVSAHRNAGLEGAEDTGVE